MGVYRQAMLGNVQLLQGEQTTRLSASRETNTVLKVQAAAKLNIQMLQMKQGCFNNRRNRCNVSCHRVFSLTWPASMQIYWNKRKRLHKTRVHLPQDWFGTPTWPPFYCFGAPIWPPRRHVKTLNTHEQISSEVKTNTSEDPEELPTATHADAGKKAQNTTLAARKTGDGIFLRKLKDILGVQEADKRFSYTFQGL